MSTTTPNPGHVQPPDLPAPEPRLDDAFSQLLLADQKQESERAFKEWTLVGIGLTALLAVLAIIVAVATLGTSSPSGDGSAASAAAPAAGPAALPAGLKAAPTLAQAKGIPYEKFQPVNPTLPAVPAGPVKKFTVSVIQHIVQVSPGLAPVQAWSYTVNGTAYRGTAASPPMVVNQGDKVQITFVNGTSKDGVDMDHSIDVHAAELAPNLNYVDVAPGARKVITFTARYAGVFMYHCATQPVLMHTGAGMTGMIVVKPRHLAPVAKELWLVQGEDYIGQPGGLADMAKMTAENPDVIAFNGYANEYKYDPIPVPVNKPIRLYVLNAGPSKWSAFHVIGDLFDTVDQEGVVSHGAQTVNLSPAMGAVMTLTLPQAGDYTFVTHSFGDMVKGGAGILRAGNAPLPKATPGAPVPTGGSTKPVLPSMVPAGASGASSTSSTVPAPAGQLAVTLGEMFIKAPVVTAKAGKVTFAVTNQGQMTHWFGIMKAPVALSGGNFTAKPLAQSAQLSPGQSATVTAHLPAGSYELVCLMPGHYGAGQHMAFTVTG
ncbi:MAG TPA: multicopper oxidase domain-containing protein [Solirubrobacteraceae bacterium]|nr:multicopper oxidase domain-containing protein [Solirubrobacteraceae bacterium]